MTLQEQMDLLQIKEITTERQEKNGTRIFQLPIKKHGKYIQVGSFNSGYVRRMDCEGYRGGINHYQINKCKPYVEYYKDYKWEQGRQVFTGKYRKYVGKSRILINKEEDRLKYLISYCLKNYYINQANMIEDGKFVPKWKYEEMERQWNGSQGALQNLSVTVNNERYKII